MTSSTRKSKPTALPFNDYGKFRKLAVLGALYILTATIITAAFMITPTGEEVLPFVRLFIIFFASILLAKYFFYMIVSPWHDVLRARSRNIWSRRRPNYRPLVSIVIPAWNEGVGIISTLESVLKNTYDRMEVIVINDGSTDDSDEIIRSFIAINHSQDNTERQVPIHYHYQENGGKGSALNTGLLMTNGDIIVTIDGDCLIDQSAIAEFVKEFHDPLVMAAVGNVKIGETKSLIGLIQYMEFLFSFYFKKCDSVMNSIYIIGGAAGAFRREVFETIGGFSTTNMTEDIELSMRIQEAGMRIVYASGAIVYTEGASDLSGLMKQRLRWKRGRLETFRAYLHMFFSTRKTHSRPLTFFVLPFAAFGDVQITFEPWFLLILYYFSLVTGDFTSFLAGIIVVSSMFFVQVFFDEPNTRRLSFIFLAPIAWLLFYVITLVEWNALIRAVYGYAAGTKMVWQRWERKGVQSV